MYLEPLQSIKIQGNEYARKISLGHADLSIKVIDFKENSRLMSCYIKAELLSKITLHSSADPSKLV